MNGFARISLLSIAIGCQSKMDEATVRSTFEAAFKAQPNRRSIWLGARWQRAVVQGLDVQHGVSEGKYAGLS